MDTGKRQLQPNPRDSANILSIIFFCWTLPLFRKGYRKVLGMEDVFEPRHVDSSELLGQRLERYMHLECHRIANESPKIEFGVLPSCTQ